MPQPAIPTLVLVPGEDLHDPDALFAVARAYAHSGILVSRHGHAKERIEFTFPAVVCSSFALELFLKLFLMLDLIDRGMTSKGVKWGHSIPGLWKDVTPQHKALIAGMFNNPTGQPLTTGIERRIEVFEAALADLGSQPFVEWRYIHELRNMQIMSHGAISEVVDAIAHAASFEMTRRYSQAETPGTQQNI